MPYYTILKPQILNSAEFSIQNVIFDLYKLIVISVLNSN